MAARQFAPNVGEEQLTDAARVGWNAHAPADQPFERVSMKRGLNGETFEPRKRQSREVPPEGRTPTWVTSRANTGNWSSTAAWTPRQWSARAGVQPPSMRKRARCLRPTWR